MVGTQMFIMYGQTGPDSVDNGVYVIDTNTWAWQTTYTPNDLQYTNTGVLSPSGANISSTQNNNTESNGESSVLSKAPSGAIIGGSVAGAAVALILAAIAIAAYIRRRKRKAEAETPIVYQFSEPPTDNKTLGNNIYNGVPPYYQQFTPAGNVSATDSSTAVNSWGDNSSYRMSVMSQKPNANIQAIYQKPDAED
jgi:flagellar biosynthesis/type III secretory pathway M-ring protein FliF/YscJ